MLRAALAQKEAAGGRGVLFVAHLNHALRSDSHADEVWLRGLCQRWSVPLEVGKVNVGQLAARERDGLEAAARTARYDFLRETAERLGARFVATAHTRDDQVETILHRLLRGTGLRGLAGIPRFRPLSPSVTLVRPLLDVPRREVLDYLAANGVAYRTDSSNTDPRFTRNRLRHELLPLLRQYYNTNVDDVLLRLAAHAKQAHTIIVDLADSVAQQCVAIEQPPATSRHQVALRIRIDCEALVTQSPLVIREVFRIAWRDAQWPQQAMGFDEWQQLAVLARGAADEPPINLPENVRARRERSVLILERLDLA
jgi:tRNA(Ile)-lysidine synthase